MKAQRAGCCVEMKTWQRDRCSEGGVGKGGEDQWEVCVKKECEKNGEQQQT